MDMDIAFFLPYCPIWWLDTFFSISLLRLGWLLLATYTLLSSASNRCFLFFPGNFYLHLAVIAYTRNFIQSWWYTRSEEAGCGPCSNRPADARNPCALHACTAHALLSEWKGSSAAARDDIRPDNASRICRRLLLMLFLARARTHSAER